MRGLSRRARRELAEMPPLRKHCASTHCRARLICDDCEEPLVATSSDGSRGECVHCKKSFKGPFWNEEAALAPVYLKPWPCPNPDCENSFRRKVTGDSTCSSCDCAGSCLDCGEIIKVKGLKVHGESYVICPDDDCGARHSIEDMMMDAAIDDVLA